MTVEQRVVEQGVPIGFCVAVEQDVDGAVALAVEHGEDEDERAEHQASQQQFCVTVVL